MTEQVHLEDVSWLVRVGRPVLGPIALDVDDDERDLGEIGQAHEFGHQRDPRSSEVAVRAEPPPIPPRRPCRRRPVHPRPEPRRTCACRRDRSGAF